MISGNTYNAGAINVQTRNTLLDYVCEGDRCMKRSKQGLNGFVHPNAALPLGLNKYYLFTGISNFHRERDRIDVPIGCAAIYGIHDLLWHSLEDSWEFLLLRLKAYCPPDLYHRLRLERKNCLRVKGTLKMRGVPLGQPGEDEHEYYKLHQIEEPDSETLRNALMDAYSLLQGGVDDPEAKDGLMQMGILLDAPGDSDVKQEEMAKGMSEFLVWIFVASGELDRDPIRVFDEKVISTVLLGDERVRSIEFCEQVVPPVGGVLQAHYVLHVVGYLDDISEVVCDIIPGKAIETGLQCRTTVMPVAMPLSRCRGVAIAETHVQDGVNRDRIAKIIEANISESFPFAIKRLDTGNLQVASRIWGNGERWNKLREASKKRIELSVSRISIQQLARCI